MLEPQLLDSPSILPDTSCDVQISSDSNGHPDTTLAREAANRFRHAKTLSNIAWQLALDVTIDKLRKEEMLGHVILSSSWSMWLLLFNWLMFISFFFLFVLHWPCCDFWFFFAYCIRKLSHHYANLFLLSMLDQFRCVLLCWWVLKCSTYSPLMVLFWLEKVSSLLRVKSQQHRTFFFLYPRKLLLANLTKKVD